MKIYEYVYTVVMRATVAAENISEAFGMKPVNAEDEFEPLEGEAAVAAGGSDDWAD